MSSDFLNLNPTSDDRVDAIMDEASQRIRDMFQEGKGASHWDPTQFPRAKNVIDWVTNPQFLGRFTLYDYPRQYQILRDSYELLCPNCNNSWKAGDCWDRTVYDMQSDVLLEYGICPKCGVTRSELRDQGRIEEIEEVITIIGMRSGKTTTVGSYDSTYIAHRYMTLKDPISYFGVDRSVILEAGFFASSEKQTEETVWGYFQATLLATEWYQRYISGLKEFSEKLHLPWESVYKHLSTSIKIVPQSIQFVRYHSNAATTAGRTRFLVAIDEMGMFKSETSDEIYSIPNASLKTLISHAHTKYTEKDNDVPPVRMLETGSPGPNPETDPLEHRYIAATTLPLRAVYAVRYATWEANRFITRESLQNEFLSNPALAEQQYGAKALPSGSKFFSERLLDQAFSTQERPGIYWSLLVRPHQSELETVYYHQALLNQINLGTTDGPLLIVGDAGKTRDRFALAIIRTIGTGSASFCRVEGLIQIIPGIVDTPHGKRQTEVFYPCVLPIIKSLHELCKVSFVLFDRWDSTMLVQQIREMGIPAMTHNTTKDDYKLARGEFMAGRVRIPCMVAPHMAPAYENLRTETLNLRQDSDGKIDHPSGKHNDVIQVVCQAIASSLEFPDLLKAAKKESNMGWGPKQVLPAVVHTFIPAGRSMGSRGVGSETGEIPESVKAYYRSKRHR